MKLLTYQVKQGETISSIAQDFRISTAALLQANPSIQSVIYAGQHIIIPNLPDPSTIPYSIIVYIGAKKLELYRLGRLIRTYPIAVGKILTTTPTGEFYIVNRQPKPGVPVRRLLAQPL